MKTTASFKKNHLKLQNPIVFENEYCVIAQTADTYIRFDKITNTETTQNYFFDHSKILKIHPKT